MPVTEHRVYGPPGTGKTTYLQKYCENAAEHYGGYRVMVCSYTTAAAAEITRRVLEIPEDNIGTLHRFCYNAIGKPPVLEAKASYLKDWNETEPAYALTLSKSQDINSGLEISDSDTPGDKLFALTTILRNRMVPRDKWPDRCQAFYEAWSHWKHVSGGIDFTDMLEIALRDVHNPPDFTQIIFVDESQDCTALQFAVLKQWAENVEKLIMVGDDDQCIYQFAGATPEAFAAHEVTANDKVLTQSYRVPSAVHSHAVRWIEKVKGRITKEYKPRDAEGFLKRVKLNWKQGPELAELIYQGICKYSSVMVIGACSYMLEPVKKALIEAGIPFGNPYRLIRADWNPLHLGSGTTMAERIISLKAITEQGRCWTKMEFKAWTSVLKADGCFVRGAKKKIEELDESFTLSDIRPLFEEEAWENLIWGNLDWWYAHLVNDDARTKANYPIRVVDRFGEGFLNAAEVPPPVTIGTIHSVKGGEADVVILFPDLSTEGMQEWTGNGQSAIRRLFYVAMTRAREGLIIANPLSPYTCDC